MSDLGKPADVIDAAKEPDASAVLDGVIDQTKATSTTRYGTFYVHVLSDLYLFQIAADYHFQFVRHYLKNVAEIMEFSGSWSEQLGPLSVTVSSLF